MTSWPLSWSQLSQIHRLCTEAALQPNFAAAQQHSLRGTLSKLGYMNANSIATSSPWQWPWWNTCSVIKLGKKRQAQRRGRHKDALDTPVSALTAFPLTASSRRPPRKPLRLLTCALLIPASLLCSLNMTGMKGWSQRGKRMEGYSADSPCVLLSSEVPTANMSTFGGGLEIPVSGLWF